MSLLTVKPASQLAWFILLFTATRTIVYKVNFMMIFKTVKCFQREQTSFCNYRYHPLLVVRKNDNLRRFYILTSLSLNPEAVYIFYIQSVIVGWNIQQSFICVDCLCEQLGEALLWIYLWNDQISQPSADGGSKRCTCFFWVSILRISAFISAAASLILS